MFPTGYFPPSYFAPNYFPREAAGSVAGNAAPQIPPHPTKRRWAAYDAILREEQELAERRRSLLQQANAIRRNEYFEAVVRLERAENELKVRKMKAAMFTVLAEI